MLVVALLGGPGSGRHPEHGSFKKDEMHSTKRDSGRAVVKHDAYVAPSGQTVHVYGYSPFSTNVQEADNVNTSARKTMFDGTKKDAQSFVKERYGISHR